MSPIAPGEQLSGNRLEQVHHRLLTFDTEWPQLRRWILKFGGIVTINANKDIGIYSDVCVCSLYVSVCILPLTADSVYEAVRDKVQGGINKVGCVYCFD